MTTIKIIIACLFLLIVATLAGALWVTTWSLDDKPMERRELTQADIIKALREDARKEEDSELHSEI